MQEVPSVLNVECPECYSQPGEACDGASTLHTLFSHPLRWQTAAFLLLDREWWICNGSFEQPCNWWLDFFGYCESCQDERAKRAAQRENENEDEWGMLL